MELEELLAQGVVADQRCCRAEDGEVHRCQRDGSFERGLDSLGLRALHCGTNAEPQARCDLVVGEVVHGGVEVGRKVDFAGGDPAPDRVEVVVGQLVPQGLPPGQVVAAASRAGERHQQALPAAPLAR